LPDRRVLFGGESDLANPGLGASDRTPPDDDRPTLVVVVGPTASGKSDLAVALAQELGAEVVNADSMQLYAGMDVGTAKLTLEQRHGVVHHLLDIWQVTHSASVVEYRDRARAILSELSDRGRPAVLVGGSGLYVHAVVDDWDFPGTDPGVRAELEHRLAAEGPQVLHAELARLDPAAAAHVLPGNGRRIVRALEVVQLTGSFEASLPRPGSRPGLPCVMVGLDPGREGLDEVIETRIASMWGNGWVEEVRGLEEQGLREGRTASRALGYHQILAVLAGQLSETQAFEQTVHATRRFSRRQRSWFRRDPRINWLTPGDGTEVAEATRCVTEGRRGPD
jgi:tRNA dimethylallyltransferase